MLTWSFLLKQVEICVLEDVVLTISLNGNACRDTLYEESTFSSLLVRKSLP